MKKVFVGNIPHALNETQLSSEFDSFGTIVQSYIDRDGAGGSNGWGTVEYTTDQAGDDAIAAKDGTYIGTNQINVSAYIA